MRIGLDFDNTIIGYSDVFVSAAKERRLLGPDVQGASKQAVRDAIRLLPDGEITWQRLQGFVYGRGIREATMFAGVDRFLRRCRAEGHMMFIVSHKTEYGHYDPSRVNLREAALGWMEAQGFFAPDIYAVPRENVFFETSRAEKLKRIAALKFAYFIDDLEEVLTDPDFPPGVNPVLFGASSALPNLAICSSWRRVAETLFDD